MGAVKENLVPTDVLQPQEIPYDHPDSQCMFDGQFVATRGAIETHGDDLLASCIIELQRLAKERNGIDYLQVFRLPKGKLWLMDNGYHVTALLPDEY